jgi:hypothetical protein
MILEATDVGKLVVAEMARESEGRLSRVFRNSAYIESESGLVLLLRGGPRSPFTINVDPIEDFAQVMKVDDRCSIQRGRVEVGELTIRVDEARIYGGALGKGSAIDPVSSRDLLKGTAMIRMLYDVSPPGLDLIADKSFQGFVRSVLVPLSDGQESGVYSPENYLPLVGLGAGFTPAGDDFIGGFIVAYNHLARSTGAKTAQLPLGELVARTVPESACLLDYAQRGYVDEGIERLVLSALGGRSRGFFDELLTLARRGHTSGVDVSLGVLLCAAAAKKGKSGGGALKSCLRALA